jgi:flagellar M-ring protein FliF
MSDMSHSDFVPAPAAPIAPALRKAAFDPAQLLGRVRALGAQPAVARSLPLLGVMAVVAAAILIWVTVSSGPNRVLFSSLDDRDKSAVVEALSAAGIDYKIDSGTGAISVPDEGFYRARMLLASQGLPKSAPDGDEMIKSLPLGASRAVETERLRSAKELDLARSIEAIDAVESARVHLAIDTPSPFIRDHSERTASVILRLRAGRVLGPEQVQAVVHLVASSVPDLAPESVSVIDQNGKLLSSGAGDAASAASDRQTAIQTRMEERYRSALSELLTPILGPDNFTAEVHAELDFSENQATRESFPKDASTLRSEAGGWTGGSSPDNAGGIPGAVSNQAPSASSVAAAPGKELSAAGQAGTPGAPAATPTRTAENYSRDFALGHEVSVSRQLPGQLKRLTVAVAVKQAPGAPRTPKDLAEIDALVKGAVGFDAARGDVIALSVRNFAPPPESDLHWWDSSWVSTAARNLGGLGLAALLIFGIARPLLRGRIPAVRRRSPRPKTRALPGVPRPALEEGSEAVLAALDDAAELAAGPIATESDPAAVMIKMMESAPSYEMRAVLIRDFVRENPDRAALVVRDLLRDDKAEGADRNG